MNRSHILTLLFVFCATMLNAQVRESIVVVLPKLSDEGVAMYRSIASDFRNRGLADLADYFEALTEGGFGSGYLAADRYGRSVVVTNRHVVTFADSVAVIRTDEDGTEVSIEGCRVIYEDDDIDFALILLRDGAFADAPRLELAESVPKDGITVWSAGYPGLFGKPSWQLAKGVVTNHHVVVDNLGLPEYAVFTQHSAPIDPGNSGGPLLVGDPGDPSSLRVVGINTWMVWGRQSSNFAISLDMLREAFRRVDEAGKAPELVNAVRDKAEKLVASLNGSEWSRFESRRYISSRMVSLQGWEVFTPLLSSSSEDEAKVWIERFLAESPEETLRQAIYYRMYNALHKEGQSVFLESVEEVAEETGETCFRTVLSTGKKVFLVDWHEEASGWRILEAGIPSAGISGPRQSIVKERPPHEKMPSGGYRFPDGLILGLGVTSVPTMYGWETGFREEIGYHFGLGRFASVGFSTVVDQGASLVESSSQSMLMVIGIEAQGRLGVPILLNNSTLFPYLGGGMRGGLAPNWSGSDRWRVSLQAEIGLMLRRSSKWSFGFSVGPSFATDNQVRLESIPVKLFLLSSLRQGTNVTEGGPDISQQSAGNLSYPAR